MSLGRLCVPPTSRCIDQTPLDFNKRQLTSNLHHFTRWELISRSLPAGSCKRRLLSGPPSSEPCKPVPRSNSTTGEITSCLTSLPNWSFQQPTEIQSFKLSRATCQYIQHQLELNLLREEVVINTKLHQLGFRRGNTLSGLDATAQHTMTNIIRTHGLDVASAARLARGESQSNPRPNKALCPEPVFRLLAGYEHRDILVSIMQQGIEPKWKQKPPRRHITRNHKSCQNHLTAVIRSIRDGQDKGRYLIVDDTVLDDWDNIVCSPLGAVDKKDIDPAIEVRLIHDLSFPEGDSTNSSFDKACVPEISYKYVSVIADRIEELAVRFPNLVIRMLKGDVKSAYRHLMMSSQHVHWMAARRPEEKALIVDLSAPFGWSGSPPFYAIFGRAITFIVQQNAPNTVSKSDDAERFWGFEWVDDHLLVEPDCDDRLELAEATLRHAMLAVLGPRSINEDKFSTWSTRLNVLGLTWDTVQRTVSMPSDKIKKALDRVNKLTSSARTTKSDLMKLMGSLRHVCSCLRTARPFYQRLQTLSSKASRFGTVNISSGARTDLKWFAHILAIGRLHELPLAIFGSRSPQPNIHIYMDASNMGLAVLNPSVNEFVQIHYDAEGLTWIMTALNPNSFSINVREHFCIALAVWIWGPSWKAFHRDDIMFVQCWSDSTSAVAWSNSRSSSNVFSQELNRAIGLGEVLFNIRVHASHLPGSSTQQLEEDLSDLLGELQSHSLAGSSRVKYAKTWQQWTTWCSMLGFSLWLPPQTELHSYQLALFGVHCWKFGWNTENQGNSATTVISKISHIAWHHRRVLGYSVGLSDGHKLAINSMRRQ